MEEEKRFQVLKTCSKCQGKRTNNHSSYCPVCLKAYKDEWYKNNKEHALKQDKEWRNTHKEKKKLQIKNWRENNPEKVKEHQRKGNLKTRSTLRGRINDALSSAMYRSLRENKNGRPWESLVGYTVEDLKKHIAKQFQEGMSWDNYGKYTWHIDHKIPVSAFNITSPGCIDFKKCWALSNLQPLRAKDNHSKHSRLEKPFQPSLALEVSYGGRS